MFITYYNHPYYNDHLERLGYRKDTDWIEYKLQLPAEDSELAKKLHRIAEHVKKSRHLHPVKIRTHLDFVPIIPKVFRLINLAYSPLYSTVELSDKQVKKYSTKFLPMLSPATTSFVKNEQGELVAFGVCVASLARAMQQSRGRFLPFGWVGVLRDLWKNDTVDLLLIAVRPDLQGAGINAIILDEMMHRVRKKGIRYAETGPMLETNEKILAQWKLFDKEQHKRRRCYVKDVGE
jgi:GNAT superfamily N-acetyltransferase